MGRGCGMLERSQKLAIYLEGAVGGMFGKMGAGVLRYSPNPVAAVVDTVTAGGDVRRLMGSPRDCPIVSTMREARDLGAEVLVLGLAPPGGLIPPEWMAEIDAAVGMGMSVVNGLHDRLAPRYPTLARGQWIWDVRIEPVGLGVGTGAAAKLSNVRLLMAGTDMAIGKMTAGLEIVKSALDAGIRAEFVATGQIGIVIMGTGVPLDAVRVDYATGAIERETMRHRDAELIVVEGQGSLIHPGSTSSLPLVRGSCANRLVLCHKAGMTHLQKVPEVAVPPLRELIALWEAMGSACGTFPIPRCAGVALNTWGLDEDAASRAIAAIEDETGLTCSDPVREGGEKLMRAVMA